MYDRDTQNGCRTTHSHGLARLCVKNNKSSYTPAEDRSSRLQTQEIKSSSMTKSPPLHTYTRQLNDFNESLKEDNVIRMLDLWNFLQRSDLLDTDEFAVLKYLFQNHV